MKSEMMNMANKETLTMTSKEIAELTGKRHDNVIRDIRKMISDLDSSLDALKTEFFEEINNLGLKVKREYFVLNKEQSLTLVSGYSVKMRSAIIKRWLELEESASKSNLPTSFAEALRLAADLEEQRVLLLQENQKKEAKLLEQQPSVDFCNNYVQAQGNLSFRALAKVLGVKEKDFRQWMEDEKINYKNGSGDWLAYSYVLNQGYVHHKTIIVNGNIQKTQMQFTPKGIEWIGKKVLKSNLVRRPTQGV